MVLILKLCKFLLNSIVGQKEDLSAFLKQCLSKLWFSQSATNEVYPKLTLDSHVQKAYILDKNLHWLILLVLIAIRTYIWLYPFLQKKNIYSNDSCEDTLTWIVLVYFIWIKSSSHLKKRTSGLQKATKSTQKVQINDLFFIFLNLDNFHFDMVPQLLHQTVIFFNSKNYRYYFICNFALLLVQIWHSSWGPTF